MPIIACQVHDGAVRSMRGIMAPASSTRSDMTRLIPITTAAVRNASGTAHRLEKRCAASQTRMTGATAAGASRTAMIGARHNGIRTPASIACARGVGIAEMILPSVGHSPVSTIAIPTTMNAPTAAGHPPSTAPAPASRAAPGVDQARVIGIRYRRESQSIPNAWVTHRTSSPDAASVASAPTAARPVSTTANELVKPTRAVTMPALIGCELLRTASGSVVSVESDMVSDSARPAPDPIYLSGRMGEVTALP